MNYSLKKVINLIFEGQKANCFLDVWTVDELLPQLGSIDHAPTVKALNVWIDKGVLIEEPETQYRLLEISREKTREPVQRMGTVLDACFFLKNFN